jgi:hypothetical protein
VQCPKYFFSKQAADSGHTGYFFDTRFVHTLQATEMIEQGAPAAGPDSGNLFQRRLG